MAPEGRERGKWLLLVAAIMVGGLFVVAALAAAGVVTFNWAHQAPPTQGRPE
jgi:hypothetical protein